MIHLDESEIKSAIRRYILDFCNLYNINEKDIVISLNDNELQASVKIEDFSETLYSHVYGHDKKYLLISTEEGYNKIKELDLLKIIFPKLTGEWEKDSKIILNSRYVRREDSE